MSNVYFSPPNSIWPNGIKEDDEGYAIFYPLGTNKVDISTVTWPDGDKLVSPFVYKNNRLVGFVDTKALTVSGIATINIDYTYIKADFSSIPEGKLTINTPTGAYTEFTWGVAGSDDNESESGNICDNFPIPDTLIEYDALDSATKSLFKAAVTVENNTMYDANGAETGTFDFNSLASGDSLFGIGPIYFWGISLGVPNTPGQGVADSAIVTFNSDLCNLESGYCMFYGAPLQTFNGALCSLDNGMQMFRGTYLTSFSSPVPSLREGSNMFTYCLNLESFNSELPKLEVARTMF